MKKTCIVVNTSRGGIIKEEDLYWALKNEIIHSAGLDVFEQEPYTGKLMEHDNCILTSHMGSMTFDCRARMEIEATEEAIRFLTGKALASKVPMDEYEVQRHGL